MEHATEHDCIEALGIVVQAVDIELRLNKATEKWRDAIKMVSLDSNIITHAELALADLERSRLIIEKLEGREATLRKLVEAASLDIYGGGGYGEGEDE